MFCALRGLKVMLYIAALSICHTLVHVCMWSSICNLKRLASQQNNPHDWTDLHIRLILGRPSLIRFPGITWETDSQPRVVFVP